MTSIIPLRTICSAATAKKIAEIPYYDSLRFKKGSVQVSFKLDGLGKITAETYSGNDILPVMAGRSIIRNFHKRQSELLCLFWNK